MKTKKNTYKALSFELKEKGNICDLSPVEKEFSLENVVMLDANLFIVKPNVPRIILSKIEVENKEENTRETLWIDKETTKAVKNYLWSPANSRGSDTEPRFVSINSINTFMSLDYDSGQPFIRQNTSTGKKRVYWEELSETDALVQLKRLYEAKPWYSHRPSY